MGVRVKFQCEGHIGGGSPECEQGYSFELVAIPLDLVEARNRLEHEGWSLRKHQRENRIRALCPACAARETGRPGLAKA